MVTMVAGGPGRDSLHSAGVPEENATLTIQEANMMMMMMMMEWFYIVKFTKKDKNGLKWFNNR